MREAARRNNDSKTGFPFVASRSASFARKRFRCLAVVTAVLLTSCTSGSSLSSPDASASEASSSPPICGGRGRETFTFEFLAIPELSSAPGDAFDLDRMGGVCNVPDGPNSVDNHLPDNLRDFDLELPGVDIRNAVDALVVCDDAGQCGSAFRLERDAGNDCNRYALLTDQNSVVASGVGYWESGSLGTVSLALLVDGHLVRLRLSGAVFRLAGDQSRLLLGGFLIPADNQSFAEDLCTLATSAQGQCDTNGFVDLWRSQSDVPIAGQCAGLSVALTLVRVASP